MQTVQGTFALDQRKRRKRPLALQELLASQAGCRGRLRLHAAGGYRLAAARALAKGSGLETSERSIDRRRARRVAPGQYRAPLAQDGGPTVNFFR